MSVPKPRGEPRDPSRTGLTVDERTSVRLRHVRRHGTEPERLVRRLLHELGLRFRVENRDLEGSPDAANRRRRWAVFVHGCFWHHHPGCSRATVPKRNRAFWVQKFAANSARDARVALQLERRGFAVVTLWECQTENAAYVRRRLRRLAARRR